MRLVMYMSYKETPIDLILCHVQPTEVGSSAWYTLADHLWYRLAGDLWYSHGRHLTPSPAQMTVRCAGGI